MAVANPYCSPAAQVNLDVVESDAPRYVRPWYPEPVDIVLCASIWEPEATMCEQSVQEGVEVR